MYYYPTIDVSACTEVTRKIAFAIYGDDNIGVAFLKVFFTILCEAKLKDKLGYLFKDFSNSKKFQNDFKKFPNFLKQFPQNSPKIPQSFLHNFVRRETKRQTWLFIQGFFK